MNMNLSASAPPTTEVNGDYMKSSQGYFVAWSLATPGHAHGEWSLLALDEEMEMINGEETIKIVIRFVRPCSGAEIVHIKSQSYLWWGMKLESEPWALVKCCPSLGAGQIHVHVAVDRNPLRATGV